MYKYLKPFSFLPAVIILCLIFSFSAQTGKDSGELSYKISYKIVELKSEITGTDKSYEELSSEAEAIHFYVRKAGHMTEYFVLALTFMLPFYVYGLRGKRLLAATLICAVLTAASDEYHQSFVDGRGPAFTDVLIDSSGALCGIILGWILLNIFYRKKKKAK